MKEELRKALAAVTVLQNYESQDQRTVLDMLVKMVEDIMEEGSLYPWREYVTRYCDVIDGPEDVRRMVDEIEEAIA